VLTDMDDTSSFGHVETRDYIDQSGKPLFYEHYSRIIPLAFFEFGDEIKSQCVGCPNHGGNLSCPPYSPSFLDYVGDVQQVLVICIRLSKEFFEGTTTQEKYHQCFKQAGRILVDELEMYRQKGKTIGGSGPCLVCDKCALDAGSNICRKPEKRIYSLESLGVNVVSLLKKTFNLDLEWDSNGEIAKYICSVGAVFF
jgi:predicted metal-binding protein